MAFWVCFQRTYTAFLPVSGLLLLYEKGSDQVKMEVPFPDSPVTGRVFAMMVSGIPAECMEYNYRIGGRIVTDPSAQTVSGREKFGEPRGKGEHCVRGGFACQQFDWGDEDKHLRIPFSESVFYELHVRGFTKSPSSKVRNRGTFVGIIEKIPYLKGLGITAVMLMPCYEFDEVIDRDRDAYRPEGLGRLIAGSSLPESAVMMPEGELRPEMRAENSPQGSDAKGAGKSGKTSGHLNYWGFGPGWFFAPKRSYSASADPTVSTSDPPGTSTASSTYASRTTGRGIYSRSQRHHIPDERDNSHPRRGSP